MKEILIGVITKIVEDDEHPKDMYVVKVDIPGYGQDFYAFPKRNEIDEPRVGENVILTEIDPTWHSYYIYEKIKENDFIGIRSRGKMIKFHDDELTIGIIPEGGWYDDNSGSDPTPSPTSWIKIGKDGTIDINAESDITIKISGNTKIESSGNCDIKANGGCTINSPTVEITGGTLKTTNGGTCSASGTGGFCGLSACLFTGAIHVGNEITGV